jgi:addiction module HigA family antidote
MTKITPTHPGEVLFEDFMKPLGLSANALAIALRVPASRIAEITKAERGVSAETALRIARYFGTSLDFWVRLQAKYDVETAKDSKAALIERDVRPRDATQPAASSLIRLVGKRAQKKQQSQGRTRGPSDRRHRRLSPRAFGTRTRRATLIRISPTMYCARLSRSFVRLRYQTDTEFTPGSQTRLKGRVRPPAAKHDAR